MHPLHTFIRSGLLAFVGARMRRTHSRRSGAPHPGYPLSAFPPWIPGHGCSISGRSTAPADRRADSIAGTGFTATLDRAIGEGT